MVKLLFELVCLAVLVAGLAMVSIGLAVAAVGLVGVVFIEART